MHLKEHLYSMFPFRPKQLCWAQLQKRSFSGFLNEGQRPLSCQEGWPSPAHSPLQWFSSHGYAQFWTPLQTKELLMHMLLWQKKVLPVQGAAGKKKSLSLRTHPGLLVLLSVHDTLHYRNRKTRAGTLTWSDLRLLTQAGCHTSCSA